MQVPLGQLFENSVPLRNGLTSTEEAHFPRLRHTHVSDDQRQSYHTYQGYYTYSAGPATNIDALSVQLGVMIIARLAFGSGSKSTFDWITRRWKIRRWVHVDPRVNILVLRGRGFAIHQADIVVSLSGDCTQTGPGRTNDA